MVRSNATPVASADANSAGSIFLTSMSPDKPCGWIWAKARVTAWCPSVIAHCEYLAEARPKLAAAAGEAAMFLDTKSPRLKPRLLGNHISRLIRRALRGKADGGHTLRQGVANVAPVAEESGGERQCSVMLFQKDGIAPGPPDAEETFKSALAGKLEALRYGKPEACATAAATRGAPRAPSPMPAKPGFGESLGMTPGFSCAIARSIAPCPRAPSLLRRQRRPQVIGQRAVGV